MDDVQKYLVGTEEMTGWYRVTDPLSPMCGCDVRGTVSMAPLSSGHVRSFLLVSAMRRVDIFVGDRPYQLVAPSGEDLGIMVATEGLFPSFLQDDIVQLTTEKPYGQCLEEIVDTRDDGHTALTSVTYERAYQLALVSRGHLVISRTLSTESVEIPKIRETFNDGAPIADVAQMIREMT